MSFSFSKCLLVLAVTLFSTQINFTQDLLGTLETELVANTDELDDAIFREVRNASRLNFEEPPPSSAHLSTVKLYHPQQDKKSIISALVEVEDENPVMYVDLNMDGNLSKNEAFEMKKEIKKNPFLWIVTVNIPIKTKLFQTFPIFLRYFKDVKYGDELGEGDRLVRQSQEAFAKGNVDIKGNKTVVIYEFDATSQKIVPNYGWLGVDSDGDGEVFIDRLSPETAKADNETIVFRAGNAFVSTKKVDLEKNQIIMREHSASDYKRVELLVGQSLQDFGYVDLDGKNRKLSEFRGKYLLIDIWGFWCGPCRREMPYLRSAYEKFKNRNFEILGLNTDPEYTPESIKQNLVKNGMTWSQARFDSIGKTLKNLRISSFPTTILIDPEGKIISLNQTNKGQPDLRGRDLLTSLDEILPE
ncbi:MAG TPA: TlpA disulfide reductase family protein [Pyrinomonadaceae bacterium]|nr:TlpA disulfide reductase family protein [Pyrinomonadaceae bacterium]